MGLSSHINTLLNSPKIYPVLWPPPFSTGIRWIWSLKSKSRRHVIYHLPNNGGRNCLPSESICSKQGGSKIKAKQNLTVPTNVWIPGRRKQANVFSCKRTHAHALGLHVTSWRIWPPKSHQPHPICVLSPCLRVQKAANKDPSRQGWLCWPPSPSAPSIYTQPSCEITGLPGTSRHPRRTFFVP